MGVIRFFDDMFEVDSKEYEILYEAALKIKGVEGALIEIGTRRGGSAKIIIDALVNNQDTNRFLGCIDPYGNIEIDCTNINMNIHYPGQHKIEGDPMSKEITKPLRFDYTNDMRNQIIPSLYFYAYSKGLNFSFFCLEDSEFFNRYADGIPTYENEKKMINQYAFVFFDGPHTNEAVHFELDFFLDKFPVGAVTVWDDIWMYDHDTLEKKLFDNGFEILKKGEIKASYVKTK